MRGCAVASETTGTRKPCWKYSAEAQRCASAITPGTNTTATAIQSTISSLRVRGMGPRGGSVRECYHFLHGIAEHRPEPDRPPRARHPETRYEPPRFELICLACEISAYAPDSDLPLF